MEKEIIEQEKMSGLLSGGFLVNKSGHVPPTSKLPHGVFWNPIGKFGVVSLLDEEVDVLKKDCKDIKIKPMKAGAVVLDLETAQKVRETIFREGKSYSDATSSGEIGVGTSDFNTIEAYEEIVRKLDILIDVLKNKEEVIK